MLPTLWDKLKATCFRSLTMAWSYVLGLIGAVMQKLDDLVALVTDASFSDQIKTILGADPKVVGKWLSIVALVTIASRVRGIVAAKKAP